MTPDEAFRRDIVAHPDDDTPRLIYADWLDDQGGEENAARAEFIRAQCRLEQIEEFEPERLELEDRAEELLRRHGQRWRNECPVALSSETMFRRGFIEDVCLSVTEWQKHAPALFASLPLRGVHLTAHGAEQGKVRVQHIDGLRRLHLDTDSQGADGLSEALGSTDVSRLEAVTIPQWLWRYFPRTPPALRQLSLVGLRGGVGLGTPILEPVLERLTHLRLNYFFLSTYVRTHSEQLLSLLSRVPPRNLRFLDLFHTQIEPEVTEWLVRDAVLAGLRGLRLLNSSFTPQDVIALANSVNRSNLRGLEVGGPRLGDPVAHAIAESTSLARLTSLTLWDARFTDAGLEALAASPNLRQLRVLRFSDCPGVTSRGIAALASSPHLSNLRTLGLGDITAMGPGGLRALGESPHLRNLRSLKLPHLSWTEADVDYLLAAPAFANVWELSLPGWSGLPKPAQARLRERFVSF